jgi:hypothetical protein
MSLERYSAAQWCKVDVYTSRGSQDRAVVLISSKSYHAEAFSDWMKSGKTALSKVIMQPHW